MAQRTVVTLTDDIDGSDASETVVFGLDGATYEIDLNENHADDLREVLAPFVAVARRPGGAMTRRGAPSGTARRTPSSSPERGDGGAVDTKAVRAWAEANGVEVSSRGRLRASVVEAFRAAQA